MRDPAEAPGRDRVTFSRQGMNAFVPQPKWAVSDKDGRYEIRGARRYPAYMVECPGDAAAAILPCQGFATDTVGYEPVTIDLKCATGVVVTGTVRNKATGKPVEAELEVEVLVNNPFVPMYPPYMHGTGWGGYRFRTDKDGRFRVVTIPGPVLVMAMPRTDDPFEPARPDPKHPAYFSMDGDYHMFAKYSEVAATRGFVRGAWCRVLDLKSRNGRGRRWTSNSNRTAAEPSVRLPGDRTIGGPPGEKAAMGITSELARIDDELHRAYEADCWHGPPLVQVLDGVTAEVAARKHLGLAHSIWELVLHLTVWTEVVRLRLTEWRPIPEPARGDFPPVTDTNTAAWAAALADLATEVRLLRSAVAGVDPARLDEIVPGKDYPAAVMLHGTAQHFAYHAGQIALLKKLATS